jgi:hypothetical protein
VSTTARIVAFILVTAAVAFSLVVLTRRGGDTPTAGRAQVDATTFGDSPTTTETNLNTLYDPVRSGESTPKGFRQLLRRDAIFPIYGPQFVSAADSGWHDKALVIGLVIDGDARAYPVSFLNRREIVNDHVGKTPVLVTW